jgi:5-methyltetrahydrofolate--homocysteine methyltransferase
LDKTIEVEVLVPYIDWTHFFTWQLFGKYPAILTDDVVGKKRLPFCRCAGNVKVILKEKKLTAKGIYGIFPANQVNDDD